MTEPVPEQFREMLQRLRRKSGLTRPDLAELTGQRVASSTIRDIESGKTRRPHRSSIERLADALMLAGPGRAAFIDAGLAPSTTVSSTNGKVEDDRAEKDQARQPDFALPSASPPRTLPYDIGSFTGRAAELEKLTAGAHWTARHGRTAVYAIEAMGGMGKTVLAVHAAHLIMEHFPDLLPDAQLFLNLRGYTHDLSTLSSKKASNALTANEALRSLLHQLGVPDDQIPARPTDRETLFRSTLAGKRALIILDNAKDTAQVRPLLPGSAACLVIVTTRDSLRGLDGTTVLQLDTPTETEAIELFTRASNPGHIPSDGTSGPTPSSDDLAKIVGLCGYLPLAIQIVAAHLRHRGGYTVADILAELQAENDRLSRLQDRERGVRAAVQSSLRYLEPAERDLFTRLALVPGIDFDAFAAASLPAGLANGQIGSIRDRLDSLLDRHLLVRRSPGRYEFHDLVRLYAQERAPRNLSKDVRTEAIDRLLDFYLHTAQVADRLFESGLPRADKPQHINATPTAIPPLRTPQDAKAWLYAELLNLIAATELAAQTGRRRAAVGLPAALSDYLRNHGPWPWALTLHKSAFDFARTTSDRSGQAGALRSIGGALSRLGEITESRRNLGAALVIYRELNNQRGVGRTLIELGIAQRVDDQNADSLASLAEALRIYEKLENTLGQAAARTELAGAFYEVNIPQAERHLAIALRLYRSIDNRQGQAAALLYRGPVLQIMGALGAAEESLREAGDIGRQLGRQIVVANSLLYLSDVQREAAQLTEALGSVSQARKIYEQLNYRQGIGLALSSLGRILTPIDPARADARLAEAVALLDAIGDVSNKGEALNARAALAHGADRKTEARGYYQEALECARAANSPRGQAAAQLGLARLAGDGSRADAMTHCQEALALYGTAKDDAGMARARVLLGALAANSLVADGDLGVAGRDHGVVD